MSTYTYRFIEYYAECVDGSVWTRDKLPEPQENIGKVFRINVYKLPEGDHRYYLATLDSNGKAVWAGIDSVEKKWFHLK